MANKIPNIPKPLMEWLQKNYPARNPHPEDSHALTMYEAGKRKLVETLQYHYDEQNKIN